MDADFKYTHNEDNALFLLIKSRDKEAFTVIYRKYHAYLYALALRYLKNTDLAEEAVQHVFVKFWENTKDIEIGINLKNYLYTMTKNYILNQIRDHKDTISVYYANAQNEIADDNHFLQRIEETQVLETLYRAIDSLPAQKKEVCKLKIEEDISNQEIADRMGISVHTVKSHYQESVKMIRTYFRKIKLMIFVYFTLKVYRYFNPKVYHFNINSKLVLSFLRYLQKG
ncbi:RNA polymerase subunit sigma-70 [Dysgonamonadaceae bacterium]|nr:RNA polymerase subunit sigma-70 [Dysgonamonadaceae bacterium]